MREEELRWPTVGWGGPSPTGPFSTLFIKLLLSLVSLHGNQLAFFELPKKFFRSLKRCLQAIEGAEPEDLIGQVHGKREDAVQRFKSMNIIQITKISEFDSNHQINTN